MELFIPCTECGKLPTAKCIGLDDYYYTCNCPVMAGICVHSVEAWNKLMRIKDGEEN